MEQIDVGEALIGFQDAVMQVHTAFGAPGDYGYGSPRGDALQALYRALNRASAVGKMARKGALRIKPEQETS